MRILPLLLLPAMVQADDWTPTAEQTAVYKALSVRDPAPSCEEIEALTSDAVATLRVIVERAEKPPWASLRAAHCLITRHPTEARGDMLAWVGDEQHRGLALLVLGALDELPGELSLELAAAGLAGPLTDDVRPRLEESDSPAIRALVGPTSAH